ncbi:MAG: hypothetical protein A2277_12930 [Desulfobacterales bacterium RIFOXYA12_FULL_46_15]|nr:MAG: hypothetical protein A2097_09705 [Desulfobacula sp. GWF2_41_7]OGR24127.1 MAG: hypothetical protein A2277_12930 [Desulfobacterales bacterium RIFOXYA12_FULL_46_15]
MIRREYTVFFQEDKADIGIPGRQHHLLFFFNHEAQKDMKDREEKLHDPSCTCMVKSHRRGKTPF